MGARSPGRTGNPATLLRLREAVGPVIGVHAKDTYIDGANTAVNGVLDSAPHGDVAHRSWIFRTVGYGHDQFCWRTLVSTLRLVGYDYVLSIEHEDPLLSVEEGLRRAVDFLKDVLPTEAPSGIWWA
jgi:sugar phosphate isomerase/epimerase